MSIDLCILASGSAGNCAAVRCPGGAIFIDIGIGPRSTAKRLEGTGLTLADIRAICLTHLDRDHFNVHWVGAILKLRIPIFCHGSRVNDLLSLVIGPGRAIDGDSGKAEAFSSLIAPFDGQAFAPVDGLRISSIALEHDEAGSHGFVLEALGCRIGYATDLGHVPAALIDCFSDLDLLALESNYDSAMELASNRPIFLKHRIMGGRGHLSNQQAMAAIQSILDGHQRRQIRLPRHIVLLHRSRQCNCPDLLRRFFCQDQRIAPRLVLAHQYERTEWLRIMPGMPAAGEQLLLAWEP